MTTHCAYCGHAEAHHRDGKAACTECVKDRGGHECYMWMRGMSREEVEKALAVKDSVQKRQSEKR